MMLAPEMNQRVNHSTGNDSATVLIIDYYELFVVSFNFTLGSIKYPFIFSAAALFSCDSKMKNRTFQYLLSDN